jgi:DNA-binding CsgD family transcriptional regulator
VEAIGRNSNLGHLHKKFAGLRKRINESPSRPLLSRQDGRKPRSKRFLTAPDIADIVRRYGVGETTQQIGICYGISKTRVAKVLCEQGVAMRRQGLNDQQATEAAKLYTAGRSLAWIGVRYDVSPTTIAMALRRRGAHLRPRPGWTI